MRDLTSIMSSSGELVVIYTLENMPSPCVTWLSMMDHGRPCSYSQIKFLILYRCKIGLRNPCIPDFEGMEGYRVG